MADTQNTTRELRIETAFVDGDTRTIALKNPKTTITTENIKAIETMILNDGGETLLIGDKIGSQFLKITQASRVNSVTTTLDLGL